MNYYLIKFFNCSRGGRQSRREGGNQRSLSGIAAIFKLITI